ncbi:hypothetical protein [Nocardia brasiliensis]
MTLRVATFNVLASAYADWPARRRVIAAGSAHPLRDRSRPPGPRTVRGFTITETAEITDLEKADISVLADSVVEHIACTFSESDDGSTDKVTYHQEMTERAA